MENQLKIYFKSILEQMKSLWISLRVELTAPSEINNLSNTYISNKIINYLNKLFESKYKELIYIQNELRNLFNKLGNKIEFNKFKLEKDSEVSEETIEDLDNTLIDLTSKITKFQDEKTNLLNNIYETEQRIMESLRTVFPESNEILNSCTPCNDIGKQNNDGSIFHNQENSKTIKSGACKEKQIKEENINNPNNNNINNRNDENNNIKNNNIDHGRINNKTEVIYNHMPVNNNPHLNKKRERDIQIENNNLNSSNINFNNNNNYEEFSLFPKNEDYSNYRDVIEMPISNLRNNLNNNELLNDNDNNNANTINNRSKKLLNFNNKLPINSSYVNNPNKNPNLNEIPNSNIINPINIPNDSFNFNREHQNISGIYIFIKKIINKF